MSSAKPLSVRAKMLLALAAGLIVLCLALLAASSFVIQSGFGKIERDAMQKDLSRLSDELNNSVNQQLVKLKDWSTWDDSYSFAGGTNPDFIPDNLPDSALHNLDLEFVAYFDPSGELIYAKEIDHMTGESASTTDTVAAIASDPLLTIRPNFESSIGGYIALPKGPLMLGSLPLLHTDGTGPTTGSMIFARYLDAERVKALGDLIHLSIDAFSYDSADLPEDVRLAKAQLSAGAPTYVAPLSPSTIAGYLALKDVHGNPIMLFRITEARPIHAQGNVSIATFYAAGGAGLIVFAILVLFLLDRLVIARFLRLTQTVEKINETRDLSVRVSVGERDEIGTLAGYVNQMLVWLSEAKEAEAKSRREIVNLLDELKTNKEQDEEIKRITGEGK